MNELIEAKSKEIKRLHTVCNSKDVIIRSACEMIKELLEKMDDVNIKYPITDELKEAFLKEVRYFEENLG